MLESVERAVKIVVRDTISIWTEKLTGKSYEERSERNRMRCGGDKRNKTPEGDVCEYIVK